MDEVDEDRQSADRAADTDAVRSPEMKRLCQQLCDLACRYAKHLGFRRQDVEDCGSGFVAHMLARNFNDMCFHLHDTSLDPWFYRCAINWTLNFYRHDMRRSQYEAALLQTERNRADVGVGRFAAADPGPYENLLDAEVHERILAAVTRLPASQQELFTRHYLQDETIAELASTSDREPNTVRQALWALRRNLRRLLAQEGLDDTEAAEYLMELSTEHTRRQRHS